MELKALISCFSCSFAPMRIDQHVIIKGSAMAVSPNFAEADDRHEVWCVCEIRRCRLPRSMILDDGQLSDDLTNKVKASICHEINFDDLDHFPLLL